MMRRFLDHCAKTALPFSPVQLCYLILTVRRQVQSPQPTRAGREPVNVGVRLPAGENLGAHVSADSLTLL